MVLIMCYISCSTVSIITESSHSPSTAIIASIAAAAFIAAVLVLVVMAVVLLRHYFTKDHRRFRLLDQYRCLQITTYLQQHFCSYIFELPTCMLSSQLIKLTMCSVVSLMLCQLNITLKVHFVGMGYSIRTSTYKAIPTYIPVSGQVQSHPCTRVGGYLATEKPYDTNHCRTKRYSSPPTLHHHRVYSKHAGC